MADHAHEEEWVRIAREYGAIDERRNILFDRVLFEAIDAEAGRVTLRLITPLRAPRTTDDGRKKTPPYRFERASDGHHALIPIRWFVSMLEMVRDNPMLSAAERAMVAMGLNGGLFRDALVPLSQIRRLVVPLAQGGEEDTEFVSLPTQFIFDMAAWGRDQRPGTKANPSEGEEHV